MSKWTETETFKRLQREDPFFDYHEEDYAGVYKITNLVNGKVYIGQSRDTLDRIYAHKKDLRGNYHSNPHLQSAWNKYGEDSFSFDVVTYCPFNQLYKYENFWMNVYESYDRELGYNIALPSADGTSFSHSEESKKKMSETMKIVMIKYSDEELLSYLHEFFYMEGRTPTTRGDLITERGYPSIGTYELRFGDLKNALVEAGLYDFVNNKKLFDRKELTREDVVDNFRSFIEEHGRFPSAPEQRDTVASGLHGTNTVLKHFDSIQELKDVFGFTREKEIEEENNLSLVALKELHDKQGFIERDSIDKSSITRSTKFYSNRFGSLYTAYKLAGIDYQNRVKLPIVQLLKDGIFINEWASAVDAYQGTGVSNGSINHVLKGRNMTAGGFKWIYKDDYLNL